MNLFSLMVLVVFDLVFPEISVPAWFYVGMLISSLFSQWLLSQVDKS
jgi:hypothetical protein